MHGGAAGPRRRHARRRAGGQAVLRRAVLLQRVGVRADLRGEGGLRRAGAALSVLATTYARKVRYILH